VSATVQGPAETATDREKILHVHDEWWIANDEIDVPRMRACFAGERYHMFNLNAHTYWGLEEKTKLWEAFHGHISLKVGPSEQMRLDINGDLAWLACEVDCKLWADVELPPHLSGDKVRVRATEIYERQPDGAWKMVHFHCSNHAPADEPRFPFGDTLETREPRGELHVRS
jgi:ketosteroid isomerase-like protein